MPAAALPEDELWRLVALWELDVLDTGPEKILDAIARAASMVCEVPIALISLVDEYRQWFKANVGLDGVCETPRDVAFCAHAILQDELLEVPNATQDPRFADNPLVLGAPHIRFYAGAPLILADGTRIGTLCTIDMTPNHLEPRQRAILTELAFAAARAMELKRAEQGQAEAVRQLRLKMLKRAGGPGRIERAQQEDSAFL